MRSTSGCKATCRPESEDFCTESKGFLSPVAILETIERGYLWLEDWRLLFRKTFVLTSVLTIEVKSFERCRELHGALLANHVSYELEVSFGRRLFDIAALTHVSSILHARMDSVISIMATEIG